MFNRLNAAEMDSRLETAVRPEANNQVSGQCLMSIIVGVVEDIV